MCEDLTSKVFVHHPIYPTWDDVDDVEILSFIPLL